MRYNIHRLGANLPESSWTLEKENATFYQTVEAILTQRHRNVAQDYKFYYVTSRAIDALHRLTVGNYIVDGQLFIEAVKGVDVEWKLELQEDTSFKVLRHSDPLDTWTDDSYSFCDEREAAEFVSSLNRSRL